MPSFFIAETLKYLCLLNACDEALSLHDMVLNTEAHPLPLFIDGSSKVPWSCVSVDDVLEDEEDDEKFTDFTEAILIQDRRNDEVDLSGNSGTGSCETVEEDFTIQDEFEELYQDLLCSSIIIFVLLVIPKALQPDA